MTIRMQYLNILDVKIKNSSLHPIFFRNDSERVRWIPASAIILEWLIAHNCHRKWGKLSIIKGVKFTIGGKFNVPSKGKISCLGGAINPLSPLPAYRPGGYDQNLYSLLLCREKLWIALFPRRSCEWGCGRPWGILYLSLAAFMLYFGCGFQDFW